MILIVGASGELGSRITKRLIEAGKPIRILARENPSYQTLGNSGAQIVKGDLKDADSLAVACQGIDTVITTASAVMRGGEDTLESVDLHGTANLIKAAQAAGVKHFIYVSSTVADPTSQDAYAGAKGKSEQRLRASGMNYTILRPYIFLDFWLYMLVGTPLQAGQVITLVGQGDHKHSFVALQDAAAFAVAVVDNPTAHNQDLLIGGPQPVCLTEVVEQVSQLMGKQLAVNYVPIGSPVPMVPEYLWGFLYMIESTEVSIDMRELTQIYGVTLTPAQELARQMFLA